MGFKWFRARLTMNRVPKSISSTPGFYRSMSQFDCDVNVQPSVSRVNRYEPDINAVSTSPVPIAVNPMAALNSRDREKSTIPENNAPISTESNREDETDEYPDDGIEIPRHLPRESIEMMRSGSAERSPRQLMAKTRKGEFKKKKTRAPPLPRTASENSIGDNRKFTTLERGRTSDGSEIEI